MVRTKALHKIVEYLQYHVDNPAPEIEKPLKSTLMTDIVGKWDAAFIEVDRETLFDLVQVVHRVTAVLPPLHGHGAGRQRTSWT
jgi:hypothetical protein